MSNGSSRFRVIAGALLLTSLGSVMPLTATPPGVPAWSTAERADRLEVRRGGDLVLAWQLRPLSDPVGGEKLAASAFLHELRTPSGFAWTTIQPGDHLHHFGLWWPWKFIEVDGVTYNSWEIQQGQGAHVARAVRRIRSMPDGVELELTNTTRIRKPDGTTLPVIAETARVAVSMTTEAQVLDISLRQMVVDGAVTIVQYRYSGFSWRGPEQWNAGNSRMITSAGHDRDHANGQPARWVLVSGPRPGGTASVLILSAAEPPEKLRVWDAKTHDGAPFVNLNPVMDQSQPLDEDHPTVAGRQYRVMASDREMDAAGAEAAWREWRAERSAKPVGNGELGDQSAD